MAATIVAVTSSALVKQLLRAAAMASSVCCVVYASHEKLRVQSSLGSWMLRGPVAWRLRTVLVPASRLVAAEGGDLCKDSVDGGLQGDLQQVAEVSCRGEGPCVLEREDLRVVPVEAGVLEGLSGLVGRLGQQPAAPREEGGEEEGGKREEGRGRREEGGRKGVGGGRES